jgi:hypothetical protein
MDFAFRRAISEARRHGNLYFASLLTEDRILKAFGNARSFWQGWIYTPTTTIWVFLAQCLSADHSCREAVAGLIRRENKPVPPTREHTALLATPCPRKPACS